METGGLMLGRSSRQLVKYSNDSSTHGLIGMWEKTGDQATCEGGTGANGPVQFKITGVLGLGGPTPWEWEPVESPRQRSGLRVILR